MTDKTAERGFRLAVAGKGGVGKTTLVALLAELLTRHGYQVLVADEDPQMNLALSLGVPLEEAEKIVPLSYNKAYIEEKTGAKPGSGWGGLLRLNPDVSDVVQRFGVQLNPNLSLLAMGSVDRAASGCLCPENSLLKAVIRFVVLKPGEIILVDTQAGPEHFGRGLLKDFSLLLVVAEPTSAALQVAQKSMTLAEQLAIPQQKLVINKVRGQEDQHKVKTFMKRFGLKMPPTYFLPYTPDFLSLEPTVASVLDKGGKFTEAFQALFVDIKMLIPKKLNGPS
ncbi:MAG: carbon monoxide dehydrogenase [Deltaproteobacteria bacterium]|nr:MAG: carbon monoxide dehydrogenase [Deltaproteobacteria bacterium]